MKRRVFIQTLGCGASLTFGPGLLKAGPDDTNLNLRELLSNAPNVGYFPNVSGPRIQAWGEDDVAVLATGTEGATLFLGPKPVPLGTLQRGRLAIDDQGVAHVVGTRGLELIHIRVGKDLRPATETLAALPALHPATGLDVAWTRAGLIVVGPGPEVRTLACYTVGAGSVKPRVLTRHAWSHPVLFCDRQRDRLHLVMSPWNDNGSIYDVVYYLRSDDDGRSWGKADGNPLELPLQPTPPEYGREHGSPEQLSITGQPAGGHSNTLGHCVAVDSAGNPHVLYSFNRPYHLFQGREPLMRCVHVGFDGKEWSRGEWDPSTGKWRAGELSADFSRDVAGGALRIVDGKRFEALVLFRDRKRLWLDLGITMSEDAGRTWQPIRPLTRDAEKKAANYVAPVWVRRGLATEVVCTAQNKSAQAPIYRGRLEA